MFRPVRLAAAAKQLRRILVPDTQTKRSMTQAVPLPPSHYHQAISSLLLSDKNTQAANLFEQVCASNSTALAPCVHNSVLAALSDDGCWEFARMVFDEMLSRGIAFNNVGLGVFIGGFCRVSKLDETLSLTEKVKHLYRGINGSVVAALIVNGLCRVGRIEEAWRVLEELRRISCKPDFIAYRIVAEAFKTSSRLEDERIILKQKRKLGVAPRANDYGEFLLSLISERRFSVAKELGEAIVSGDFPIEDDVLNALIGSVSSIYPNSGIAFCKYMIHKERFPTLMSLSNLCSNLSKNKKTDEMWEIFSVLLSKGYFMELEQYNVMISYLCKAGRVREAYEVLKEMKKKGFSPDISSYNSLMEACCRDDLMRPAKRLWDEMFANGCDGNLQTYNILIQKFTDTDDAEEAWRLFHHMLEKGVAPDFVTYASVIKAFCRTNRVDDACEVLKKSIEQDTKLSSSVLRMFILCLCQEGNFSAASNVMHGLPSNIENSDSHVILLKSLIGADKVERATEHIDWIRDNYPSKMQTISTELIASLSTAPKLEASLLLLRAMRERGLLFDNLSWMDAL